MATFREILTKLFTRNVVIKRLPGGRLKTLDVNKSQSTGSPTTFGTRAKWRNGRNFNSTSGYGSGFTNEEFEAIRKQMYIDYELMDTDSIVSAVCNIVSDESTTVSETGELIVIKTDDVEIKKILHNLFYDVLNIEFNLWSWIRTTVKYGDSFLFLQIAEEIGVVNVMPIHPSLMVREEGTVENPDQIRFRYEGDSGFSYGSKNYFEQFEVAHFRLLGDTNFLPYGKSYIEGARKEYKRLLLMEDAMMISRIMRAPERRLFKIDIGNISPDEVDGYMEQITQEMKKTPYIDPATGDYNLAFNIQSSIEDFYLPVRGGETGTDITTLPGLANDGMKEDVEYFKNKMIAALSVPKEYLGYADEGGGEKCLHPDTKIPLLNGTELTIKEISEIFEQVEDPNIWVYSFDFETNSVIPGKIKLAKKTRLNANLVRVYLDNDSFVDCTPDHNFLLKDGTKIQAQNLSEGDSLRAIYRRKQIMRKDSDYEQIYQPKDDKWQWTHSLVDEYFNGKIENNGYVNGKFIRDQLIIRHHVDFNRFNNNPDNLQRVNHLEHCRIHVNNMAFGWHSKETQLKSQETQRKPENRERASKRRSDYLNEHPELKLTLVNHWKSLTFEERSKIIKSGITEESRQIRSERAKRVRGFDKAREVIKLKFPNGRTDLQGSNHVKWTPRPEFDVLISFINNYEGNLADLNKFSYFAEAIGIRGHALKDTIRQNGYTIHEFMNQYFGFRKGRPHDLRIDYINDIASNHNSIDSLVAAIGISKGTFIHKIKKQCDFDEWQKEHLGKCFNHKVLRVEFLTEVSDTYNLEVDDKNHNFLISNGIVIKNSGLAAIDLRFARTIERIQKIIVSELYKIAVTHLYVQGFRDEELLNFELTLTNPSLIYERQRVDIMTAKVDLIKSIREDNLFSDKYIYEVIMNQTEDEWKADREQLIESAKFKFRMKELAEAGNDPEKSFRSFTTPYDLASLQVSSKLDVGNGEEIKKLYTPDGREENEGKPQQFAGSFETKRDQDFGRDPVGRRDLNKQESVKRIIKGLDKFNKKTNYKKTLTENTDLLNDDNLIDDTELN